MKYVREIHIVDRWVRDVLESDASGCTRSGESAPQKSPGVCCMYQLQVTGGNLALDKIQDVI